jgi:hypothetical protein
MSEFNEHYEKHARNGEKRRTARALKPEVHDQCPPLRTVERHFECLARRHLRARACVCSLLAGVKIGGPNQNPWGWFEDLPANEGKTARHQVGVTPCDLPREGWTRNYDNPHVCDLREYLKQNNGIKGLEICEPHEVEKAVRIFHRDGFVAVKDCLSPEILARMRATTDRAIMQAIESGPPGAHSAPSISTV